MDDWAKELPGAELVYPGIAELARGEGSAVALLVAIGSPRLRRLGFRLPENAELPKHPELLLYRLLRAQYGKAAHSQYNALIRRLVSFERAAEFRQARLARGGRATS
ncbi:MAG: hypothetical protein ACREYF_19955 [Gammaproteobacteria bacterium]